jgi:HEPN domain-containing protein
MNRHQWRAQAIGHIEGAKSLLSGGHFSSAYYLAGLAVECGLKACIARKFKIHTWPERKFVDGIYIHNLTKLLGYADLVLVLKAEERRSGLFSAHWNTVKGWTVDSRYETWSQAEAIDMVEAASKRGNGVLSWIKRHW